MSEVNRYVSGVLEQYIEGESHPDGVYDFAVVLASDFDAVEADRDALKSCLRNLMIADVGNDRDAWIREWARVPMLIASPTVQQLDGPNEVKP